MSGVHIKNDGSQIINSIITLRNLQKKGIVPTDITLQNTNTKKIIYKPFLNGIFSEIKQKRLLITKTNMIYYGNLLDNGLPYCENLVHKNIKRISQIKQLREENFYKDSLVIFPDGSYYLGQMNKGDPDGLGFISNISNSFQYKGYFHKGVPHGLGVQKHMNGIIYEGNFSQGAKNGKGILIYGENNHFEGNFKDNLIDGIGKYFYNNYMWEGQWVNGYLQGQGKQIIARKTLKDLTQASQYTGNFVKGQKEGHGRFKWGKGYQYQGKFKKGQLDGEGTFKFKGKVYAGVWTNGTQVKITELKRYVNFLGNESAQLRIPQNVNQI